MPTVEENRLWATYAWPERGDEWSGEWGDVETQWDVSIRPRIRSFLPCKRVLEIAPGHGRWTKYLIPHCEDYVGIDLNAECIAVCRERFAEVPHARFYYNDGKSLAAVEDGSIDFAFSFDSLVHVERDMMEGYLQELAKKLSPDGVAFIHHSNLREYSQLFKVSLFLRRVCTGWPRAMDIFARLQLVNWDCWRGGSVKASDVAELGEAVGLRCIGQEVVRWGKRNWRFVDCFSTLTRAGSVWDRSNIVVRNQYFTAEAASAYVISELYASLRAKKRAEAGGPTVEAP